MNKFIKDFQITFEAKSDMFQKHQQQDQQQGRQVDEQSQEGNRQNQPLETKFIDHSENEEVQQPHPYTATLVAIRARLLKVDYRFSILKTF